MPYVEGNYIYLVHFEKTLIKPKKKMYICLYSRQCYFDVAVQYESAIKR